jgi:hypothetical protein
VTPHVISNILADVGRTPDTCFIYRYIRYNLWQHEWIHWLNREPEIFEVMKMVGEHWDKLGVTSISDERETDSVIVRRKDQFVSVDTCAVLHQSPLKNMGL